MIMYDPNTVISVKLYMIVIYIYIYTELWHSGALTDTVSGIMNRTRYGQIAGQPRGTVVAGTVRFSHKFTLTLKRFNIATLIISLKCNKF